MTISNYIYGRNKEKDKYHNNSRLFRTFSQRSYSMNSTSLNTCSSVCSVQPFNSHQQTFRYFSDNKRPFVVSFRRVNKLVMPNNNNPTLIDRCSSICDIHRHELDSKNRHCRRPFRQSNGSQSCRNFNYIDGKAAKAHFDNEEESPQHDRDRITITYPKEKFHGNAKLMLTINADDVLKFNRYSINTTAAPNLYFTTTTSEQNRKFSYYLNDDMAMLRRQMNRAHKSTSTPTLNKIRDKSPDFELNERKQSFVSILNVRAKEAHLVRNSKSY